MDCSQVPLSLGFPRQERWSGLPFPSPGDLPNPGIEPGSPALEADALTSEPPGKQIRRVNLGVGSQCVCLSSTLSFTMSQLFLSGGQSIGVSVITMNIQGWFPLKLTGLIFLQSKGLSWVFSTTKFESINSSGLSLFHGPTLTSTHDYWKNHSFGCMELCRQRDVSAC